MNKKKRIIIILISILIPVLILLSLVLYSVLSGEQKEKSSRHALGEKQESQHIFSLDELAEDIIPTEEPVFYEPPAYHFSTDEIGVYVEGLKKEYTIAFVNDLHMITDKEAGDVTEENLPTVRERYETLSMTPDGTAAEELWPEIIKYLNYKDFDAVIFGGDILDYSSHSNIETLKQGLDQLKYADDKIIYLRSDHDYGGWYGGSNYTDTDGFIAQTTLWDEDTDEKVIDFGEFLVVGINKSYQNLSEDRLDYLLKEIKDGRPVIIATHVPFYSEEDDSLAARSMEVRNKIYYWNKEDSAYCPDANTQKFIDTMYAPGSNVVQILAAHLHGSWDGVAAKGVREHIFTPSFQGSIGIVHVTGDKERVEQLRKKQQEAAEKNSMNILPEDVSGNNVTPGNTSPNNASENKKPASGSKVDVSGNQG